MNGKPHWVSTISMRTWICDGVGSSGRIALISRWSALGRARLGADVTVQLGYREEQTDGLWPAAPIQGLA
jgi:hypothetical protein